jgi:homoserine kinase type II
MSVYTKITREELSRWLQNYALGSLVDFQGIASGVENTNYFVTTARGRYVLTLFERMNPSELPFYLNLMAHLAQHAIPCPAPVADSRNQLLSTLRGKPATIVTCLPGAPNMHPGERHCALVGSVLADMHLAGRSFSGTLDNPRGASWWSFAAKEVAPYLDAERGELLRSELDYQLSRNLAGLPRGTVHADLFRDNVLFHGDAIGGVIDFYFAGIDCLLFDVAVTVNDWCVDSGGEIDPARGRALLSAYAKTRPFTAAEHDAWVGTLRAAALRFWLSRLYDFYLPRAGELTHAHDPEHFRRVLESRRLRAFPLA